MTPVRFGLVGYGFGGRYFHAPLIATAPECELVGVMTSSPERQALVAREWPGTSTFASLTALVDAGVEAVAISTPADTHSSLTEQALQLGLAVVCDKPFALDPAYRPAHGRPRRATGTGAEPVSEPALGFGLPHRPKAGCRRRAGDGDPLRIAFRTLRAAARAGQIRWRHHARFREPSCGPGPGPARAGRERVRGVADPRDRVSTTTCFSPSPTRVAPGLTCRGAGASSRPAPATGSRAPRRPLSSAQPTPRRIR